MDLKILGNALGINIVKKDDVKDNIKKLTFDLYSKLSLETAEIKNTPKKNISKNPHPLGHSLFIKIGGKVEERNYFCSPSDKVLWLRENISKDCNISMEDFYLMFKSKTLQDDKDLGFYKIKSNSTIRCVIHSEIIGGKIEEFYLDDDLLAPGYDYDFTNIKDNCKFYRGGLEYKRPCGWNRYALKVYGKYESDSWLGDTGKSNNDSEWAVAYHGTKQKFADSICRTGLHPGENNVYGVGVYCTPNIETAETYSEQFTGKDGNKYKLVFQARVKPSAIVKCTDKDPDAPKDYWYIENKNNIRCYSICVKRV